jgi:glycosyltransferase involved in cell wall biosynthesis
LKIESSFAMRPSEPTGACHSWPVEVSVVMPAYNEADYLEGAVRTVRAAPGVAEIIVVENGSTDGTAALAERLAGEIAGVRALSIGRPDYGAALRRGLLAASSEVVVNFDVDYFDVGFLDEALARLAGPDGPAIVVGSKRAPGSRDERPLPRRLITSTFALVLRRGFGLHVSDTHGMKALRRVPLLPVVERCRFGTDLFDTELVLRAERAGLTVVEIPVSVVEQRPSRTSIVRRGIRSVRGLAHLRVALWREGR